MIINDLKQRRQRDYDFDWNQILQVNGDTGIKLQYTHCRLCNLKDVTGVEPAKLFDVKLLSEPIAQQLVFELAKYSEILLKCQVTLEACILVNYLFQLRYFFLLNLFYIAIMFFDLFSAIPQVKL